MFSTTNAMWQINRLLHSKDSQGQIVPALLMLVAGSLVVHNHVINDGEDYQVKKFFWMILLQMIPLAILEFKIASCADPVNMFCKFSVPVTLMHAIFLCTRVVYSVLISGNPIPYVEMQCLFGFCVAMVTLYKGFDLSLTSKCISEHSAVWRLALICFLAAAFVEGLAAAGWDEDQAQLIEEIGDNHFWHIWLLCTIRSAGVYGELICFIPAVWMMFQSDSGGYVDRPADVESSKVKKKATSFFLFLVTFYVFEDLYNAYHFFTVVPLAAFAYAAHFLLLLDFACYVLAHIYNPEKLVGELQKWLPVDLSCAV